MMSRMRLHHEITYEATPEEVFEMLGDRAFRVKVSEALDVVSHDIDVTRSGEGFTFVNDHVQKTAGLPSFAAKFTGDTTRAIQREVWEDSSGASVTIDSPGKPAQIGGTISLAPNGAGTLETIELDLKIKIPLLAGKLEQLLHDTIVESIDVEHAVGQAWLRGER